MKVELVQGSDEWKAWRSTVLGASEVPAVLGLSPYQKPWNVWEAKVHGVVTENSFILQKGHEIESRVRANYELTHDDFPPVCFQRDFIGASLDGYNGKSALEIKYVGKDHIDTIPPHHMAQIQAQLWVTGVDRVIYLPCDGTRIGTKEVMFDKDLWKSWMPTLRRFWKDVEKAGRVK